MFSVSHILWTTTCIWSIVTAFTDSKRILNRRFSYLKFIGFVLQNKSTDELNHELIKSKLIMSLGFCGIIQALWFSTSLLNSSLKSSSSESLSRISGHILQSFFKILRHWTKDKSYLFLMQYIALTVIEIWWKQCIFLSLCVRSFMHLVCGV